MKAHAIGRKALREITTIFTPDTIPSWHRYLVAKKFDSSDKRKHCRPRIRQVIVDAIVRFARENPTWGFDRIRGALKNLNYHIIDSEHGFGTILVGEEDPRNEAGEVHAKCSWREWDLNLNKELRTIKVCKSPLEKLEATPNDG